VSEWLSEGVGAIVDNFVDNSEVRGVAPVGVPRYVESLSSSVSE
jgi:hypothetical protein